MKASCLLLAWLPAAALAAEDPWKRVPALPTGCYQNDGYAEKIATAGAAITRDLDAQKKINDELQEEVKTLDPMEMASRQQQYMMDHPQEAMALMQRSARISERMAKDGTQYHDERLALEKELTELMARYEAALDEALAPVGAKFEDLDARAQPHLVPAGEVGDDYPAWAIKEWNALTGEENATYEKLCATWWSAGGPYQAWLQRFRDHLVREIPNSEEAENVGAGFMVQLVGTPTRASAPVATLLAVDEYMDRVARVFGTRWPEPRAPVESMVGMPPRQ